MSIGFHPALPPPPPPDDIVIWVVRKDVRHPRAVVRMMAHDRELRVLIGDELGMSRLYRHEDARALREFAAGTLADFEHHGWTRDTNI